MPSPLISVIAVCYNQERYVIETLESIKGQSFTDFELIAIDNCSSDQSPALMEDWMLKNGNIRHRLILRKDKQGICDLLNEMVDLAEGRYIQFISCDDVLEQQKLERHQAVLSKLGDEYALVFSDARLIGPDSEFYHGRFIQRARPRVLHVPEGEVFDTLLQDGNYIPAVTCLIRKECLKVAGGYDPSLIYEDYDMWLNLSSRYKFKFDPQESARYRLHAESFDRKIDYKVSNFPIWAKYSERGGEVVKQKLLYALFYMYNVDHPSLNQCYYLFCQKYHSLAGFKLFYRLGISVTMYKRIARLTKLLK